jgi:hypothetical protein
LARSTSRQTIAPVAEARPPPNSSIAIAARRPNVWRSVRRCGFEHDRDVLGAVEEHRVTKELRSGVASGEAVDPF